MRTRFIRFIVSSILMICMLFSSVTTSSAKKIKLEGYEYLHMCVGQYVYAYNLVYRVNGKKKEFCKSIKGFDVKSKNEDVLDYDEANGLVVAKSAGETELVVKKNGKEFIIRFYISADEPYDKKELGWINDKTDTLSRKYPEYSYLSGKGSTFMKSWCLLLKRLGGYEFGLECALWPNNDGCICAIWRRGSCSGLSGGTGQSRFKKKKLHPLFHSFRYDYYSKQMK